MILKWHGRCRLESVPESEQTTGKKGN